MSLQTYLDVVEMIEAGYIEGADPNRVNGASLDVHLGEQLLIEDPAAGRRINLADKHDGLAMLAAPMRNGQWELHPGAFALATTRERFHLPDDLAFEFKLRSNSARRALNHLLAGWADPGFHNAELTLELKNASQFSVLLLEPGLSVGQLVFWRGERPVPAERSYRTLGSFNHQRGPTATAGGRVL